MKLYEFLPFCKGGTSKSIFTRKSHQLFFLPSPYFFLFLWPTRLIHTSQDQHSFGNAPHSHILISKISSLKTDYFPGKRKEKKLQLYLQPPMKKDYSVRKIRSELNDDNNKYHKKQESLSTARS